MFPPLEKKADCEEKMLDTEQKREREMWRERKGKRKYSQAKERVGKLRVEKVQLWRKGIFLGVFLQSANSSSSSKS